MIPGPTSSSSSWSRSSSATADGYVLTSEPHEIVDPRVHAHVNTGVQEVADVEKSGFTQKSRESWTQEDSKKEASPIYVRLLKKEGSYVLYSLLHNVMFNRWNSAKETHEIL